MQPSAMESKSQVAQKKRESQKPLVDSFLRSIEGLSPEEAAAATDVNRESIRQYREGTWTWIVAATERRMRAWIEGNPPPDRDGYAAGLEFAAAEMEKKAAEFRRLAKTTSTVSGTERIVRGTSPKGPRGKKPKTGTGQ